MKKGGLRELARDLDAFQRDLTTSATRANRRISAGAIQVLRKYSSGTVKSIVLQTPLGATHNEGLGHWGNGKITKLSVRRHGSSVGLGAPYGHGPRGWLGPRGPIPYGDAGWINAQTHHFERSWRAYATSFAGVPLTVISNQAPYAHWLETGTRKKMIARPIDKFARAYIAEVGSAIFEEEFSRSWKVRLDVK